MKVIFRNTVLAALAIMAASPVIAMNLDWLFRRQAAQPAAPLQVPKVIESIENQMTNQRAFITYYKISEAVGGDTIEPQQELIVSQTWYGSPVGINKPEWQQEIAQLGGFKIGVQNRLQIVTPKGIGVISVNGPTIVLGFNPFNALETYTSTTLEAERAHVIIRPDSLIELAQEAR